MPFQYVNTCGKCAFKVNNIQSSTGYICGKTRLEKKETDYCSDFKERYDTCYICGAPMVEKPIVYKNTDGTWIEMCSDCLITLETCKTCMNGNTCTFQTDPSPEPQLVTKQFNNNGMVITTQVPNPERIKITCQNSCPCWNPDEAYCSKQVPQSCPRYSLAHLG